MTMQRGRRHEDRITIRHSKFAVQRSPMMQLYYSQTLPYLMMKHHADIRRRLVDVPRELRHVTSPSEQADDRISVMHPCAFRSTGRLRHPSGRRPGASALVA